MNKIPPETLQKIKINKYFKAARSKMRRVWSYTIDDLCPVDSMSDEDVKAVIDMLDNHPLIVIDSEYPKRWRLK